MKKIVLGLFLLVIVGLAAWYLSRDKLIASTKVNPVPAEKTFKALQAEAVPLEELKAAPKPAPKSNKEETEVEIEAPREVCVAQWERITSQSYEQGIADLVSGALELDKSCLELEPGFKGADEFYEACYYDREKHQLTSVDECKAALMLYRASKIDEMTHDRTDYASLSLPVLINKIIARFNNAQFGSEAWNQNVEMINALIEREPEMFSARKALVAAIAPTALKENDLGAIDEALKNARALNPEDSELQEIELLTEHFKGNEEYVIEFVRNNPNSAVGYYHRAAAYIKGGATQEGLADLRKALELEPGNERFQKTLERLEKDPKAKDAFQVQMGVRFEDI